jgi:3-oxoacyl-[acyl-carrier protein] reductase/(S)-1-phenylethanol dehydrogenase
VIADIRDGTEAVRAVQSIANIEALAVQCDVSQEKDVNELKKITEEKVGGCDILVHCASPLGAYPFEMLESQEWRSVLSVNLDGLFFLTRAFLGGMKRKRWGRIIPISSTTYHAGLGGRVHYVTSKAGILGFTRSLAREVGDFGITVNAIAPGLVRTEGALETPDATTAMYAIIRDQQCIRQTLVPDNLVGPLLFLASDASAFVTGQTLLVDAGWQHV